jgi:hypothetical protein
VSFSLHSLLDQLTFISPDTLPSYVVVGFQLVELFDFQHLPLYLGIS